MGLRGGNQLLLALIGVMLWCVIGDEALARRNYPKQKRPDMAEATKRRVFRVGRRYGNLSDAKLAKVLAKHPVTAKLAPRWDAAEVKRLRSIEALPTWQQNDAWLAQLTARYLRRSPKSITLEAALKRISSRRPGTSEDRLLYIARYYPTLAKQVVAALARQGERPVAPANIKLTPARVAVFGKCLRIGLLERLLSRPHSALLERMRKDLLALDRTVGNGSGRLAPKKHISRIKDPELRAVIERVYKDLGGRKELSISTIAEHLPQAVAAVARSRKPTATSKALLKKVVSESLAVLSADYNRRVVDGVDAPLTFARAWGLPPAHWAKLRRELPQLFIDPARLPLDARRLDALAVGYREVQANKRTIKTLYFATGLNERTLAALQAADPRRFPRSKGARVFQTTAHGQRQRVESRLAALGGELEAKQPKTPPKHTRENAEVLGARAWQIFRRDPMTTSADVKRVLNADKAFVARVGALDGARYHALRQLAKDKFPPLGRSEANTRYIDALIAREIKAIREAGGPLDRRSALGALQKKYPRISPSRFDKFKREHRELFVASKRAPSRSAKRRAHGYASRTSGRRGIKSRLRVNEVARLMLELAPPGTNDVLLGKALNRWLAERGESTFSSKTVGGVLRHLYAEHGGVRGIMARRVAAIVGEYARTAPVGTTQAQIFARLQREHPLVNSIELGNYKRLWRANPAAYPEIQPFVSKSGRLSLAGQGLRERRRFRGRWNAERAVFRPATKDGRLAAQLARLSQYARISVRLPVLDGLVKDLEGETPLSRHNVLMVSHLLGSTVALTDALRSAGASVARSIIVGTPYGSNGAVKKTLQHDGYDVRVPQLSTFSYQRTVYRAVRQMADRVRKDPGKKPVLVLDDGGLVTSILHRKEFRDVIGSFRVVEQTTRGITLAERQHLRLPLLSVASARCKLVEAIFIGRGVANKVDQGMRRLGKRLGGKRVTIIGYGAVGRATAKALRLRDPTIKIDFVETNSVRAAQAARRYNVVDKATALKRADVVIGATGHQSVSLAEMKLLKSGAVLASASSKRMEFAMDKLQRVAKRTELAANNPLVTLPSASYKLGKKRIIALGDGWPVNFDGDVEDIPARHIQITRAAMFAGALQVAGVNGRFKKNQRVLDLSSRYDARIRQLFSQHRRHEILPADHQDPSRWLDTVRDLTRHLRAVGLKL